MRNVVIRRKTGEKPPEGDPPDASAHALINFEASRHRGKTKRHSRAKTVREEQAAKAATRKRSRKENPTDDPRDELAKTTKLLSEDLTVATADLTDDESSADPIAHVTPLSQYLDRVPDRIQLKGGDETEDDASSIGDVTVVNEIYNEFGPDKPSDSEHRIIAICLLYTSPSPRDLSTSRMPSSA